MSATTDEPELLIPWRRVRLLAGDIGRTTAWRLQRAGDFPAPVKISPGRVAWRTADILAWQADRSKKSEAA